ASLRGVALRLCPTIPRTDGEAGPRSYRGALARYLDRPEGHQPEPAVDRRHRDRDLRLHASPVGAHRPPALSELRSSDRAAVTAADGRHHPWHAGRDPPDGPRTGH